MRRLAVAGLAVLALVALTVGSLAMTRDERRTSVTRAELEAWEKAILVPLQQGGKTVEQGMKPAVLDLTDRHVVPPYVIAKEADGWAEALGHVRNDVAAVAAPEDLKPAQRDFVAAIELYIAAAREFGAAARAPEGPERDRLVQSGRDKGAEADRVYDRGGHLVQRIRHALGLPSSSYFPEESDE